MYIHIYVYMCMCVHKQGPRVGHTVVGHSLRTCTYIYVYIDTRKQIHIQIRMNTDGEGGSYFRSLV